MGNIEIKAIADMIRESCPADGVAMRYGGDEFVVIFPDCDEKKAVELYETMQNTLKRIAAGYSVAFPIEASIGYAVVTDYEKPICMMS